MTTISSREFNHDVSAAKRRATHEPVVITDRGTPTHVLLSIAEYDSLTRVPSLGLGSFLSEPDGIDLEVTNRTFSERELDL